MAVKLLLLLYLAWAEARYTFPGKASSDGGWEGNQRPEMTNNERSAQLKEESTVEEVSTQLGEADSTSIEVSVQQRLNKETDSQLSLRLVFSGTESDWVINLRVGRSMPKSKLNCCR